MTNFLSTLNCLSYSYVCVFKEVLKITRDILSDIITIEGK